MSAGAVLGLLMLDTAFERFPGDVGHPDTFPFPVLCRRMDGLDPRAAIETADTRHQAVILAHAKGLVAAGATLISTSCGFLVLYQAALAAALPAAVVTSALLEVPRLAAALAPGERVGVLTFDAQHLTAAHLAAAGAPADTPVEGLAPGIFRRAVYGDPAGDGFAAREAEVVAAARRLVARHPEVAVIVSECTNFPPHRAAIAAATGRPVHDIVTLLRRLV